MKKILCVFYFFFVIILSSCSTDSKETKGSLESINIEFNSETDDEIVTSSSGTTIESNNNATTETNVTDNSQFYIGLKTVDDLYIEGIMGDDRDTVEICIKFPHSYEGQKVNVYKVKTSISEEFLAGRLKFTGWKHFGFSSDYIWNGLGDDDQCMSNEEVDRMVESFEWMDANKTPGYEVINIENINWSSYAGYYESPASDCYGYKLWREDGYDEKGIIFKKPFGVYSLREELDGIPVGPIFSSYLCCEKILPNNDYMMVTDICIEPCAYYNGQDVESYSHFIFQDLETIEENLPIVPLSEVIQNAFPTIKEGLIPPLFGKRIRIYAAELAYVPYYLEDDSGIARESDGITFLNHKLIPFWVVYYQTDMSSGGYQRRVALINAITGEGVY